MDGPYTFFDQEIVWFGGKTSFLTNRNDEEWEKVIAELKDTVWIGEFS
jgi:hypothetical protein